MIAEENFNELFVGMVYSMDYIHEFIERLQKKQGQEMKIHQTSKEFSIHCSNQVKDICPFRYFFAKKIDVESKQTGLQLKKKHIKHSLICKVNNQDISFQRNRLLIINSKTLTTNIILSRYKQYGPQNPKKILEYVSQAMGYHELFIIKGLKNQELKRKIKKKFDNLVAQIRKQYNLTPTKIKKNRQVKKLKPRFALFKQKSQSCEDQQENLNEEISQSDNFDDESEFEPCKKSKKASSEKQDGRQNERNENRIVQQEGNTADDLQSCRGLGSSFKVYEEKSKRKIIKKEW